MLRERGGMDRQTDRDYSIPNVVHHKEFYREIILLKDRKGERGTKCIKSDPILTENRSNTHPVVSKKG